MAATVSSVSGVYFFFSFFVFFFIYLTLFIRLILLFSFLRHRRLHGHGQDCGHACGHCCAHAAQRPGAHFHLSFIFVLFHIIIFLSHLYCDFLFVIYFISSLSHFLPSLNPLSQVAQKGVFAPLTPDLYEPLLAALKEEGIQCRGEWLLGSGSRSTFYLPLFYFLFFKFFLFFFSYFTFFYRRERRLEAQGLSSWPSLSSAAAF